MSRGFTQWLVRRTDLTGRGGGSYHAAKTVGNQSPPPVQSTVVVYVDTLEEALAEGAALMGVPMNVLTAVRIQTGYGIGESG